MAHLQPQGWNHGGHDETDMARIDARLTREIRDAGAAGAMLFAWIDEWFKKNWMVIDYEIPLENTRQWHNMMDAEQNYGMLAMFAGAGGATTPVPGGDPGRWRALEPLGPSPRRQDGAVPAPRRQRRILPLPGGRAPWPGGTALPVGHVSAWVSPWTP